MFIKKVDGPVKATFMRTPAHPSSGKMGLFRPVPRGPPEWGELLYEPVWASEWRFKNQRLVNLLFALELLVVALFGTLVILGRDDDSLSHVMSLVLASLYCFQGLVVLLFLGTMMPLRVYREGVALPTVPVLTGIRDAEERVPLERVRGVELEVINKLQGFQSIKLTYLTGKGKERWTYVSNIDDPLRALRALQQVVPDALDPSIAVLLEDASVERRKGWSSALTSKVGWVSGLHVLMLPGVFVLMAYLGVLSVQRFGSPVPTFVELALVTVAAVSIVTLLHLITRGSLLRLLREHSKVEGDALVFPRPAVLGALVRTEGRIPLDRVVTARRELYPTRFHHIACLELPGGRRVRAPVGVLEGLAGSGRFREEGDVLVNKQPVVEGASPLFSPNVPGMAALVVSMMAVNRVMASLVPGDVEGWLHMFAGATFAVAGSLWLLIVATSLLQATD